MKKVLIITYYWPPSGGSGVQRWVYFAKYFKEFGVEPIILTVNEKSAAYPSEDRTLLKLADGIEVHKTKSVDLLKFYSRLKGGGSKDKIPHGNIGNSNNRSLFDKLATSIRANFFIPDARVGWNKYALRKAKELISTYSIDVVITTGPPHSTHLIGKSLKQELGINWIVDFRDPWREVYYNDMFKRSKKNDLLDQKMELEVLEQCDHILTVGPSMQELLQKKIVGEPQKVHVYYNGYDHELMEKSTKTEHQVFTIAHIGVFSSLQPFEAFLTFIKELSSIKKIRVEVAGNTDLNIISALQGITTIDFVNHGRVTHEKAIDIMFSANLLINCLANSSFSKLLVSGKLMEYIATGNPILIIGNKEGDAAKLLNQFNLGKTFESHETNEMVKFSLDVIDGNFKVVSSETVKEFTRQSIAQKLGSFIKKM